VAIGIENELVYLRGFGHANIANNRDFHSGTIARAASGCKTVAGALALRLDQTTMFDVDDATRTHAPTLPVLHTHTVAQLLSNRGGVRHYTPAPTRRRTSMRSTTRRSPAPRCSRTPRW
jgi:CubicO group peptidase (beta-lactamase class C family)